MQSRTKIFTVFLITILFSSARGAGAETIEYKAGDLRDPFSDPFRKEKKKTEVKPQIQTQEIAVTPLPGLAVQGVIWEGRISQAIINNKVVKIGDTVVEGVRVVDINKDGVKVSFENREYILSSPATAGLEEPKQTPTPKGGSYYGGGPRY